MDSCSDNSPEAVIFWRKTCTPYLYCGGLLIGAYSLTFHLFSFPFNENATSPPTTKFVWNRGLAHWLIDRSKKFPLVIKWLSVRSWRRWIRYSFCVILLNVLLEISRPLLGLTYTSKIMLQHVLKSSSVFFSSRGSLKVKHCFVHSVNIFVNSLVWCIFRLHSTTTALQVFILFCFICFLTSTKAVGIAWKEIHF